MKIHWYTDKSYTWYHQKRRKWNSFTPLDNPYPSIPVFYQCLVQLTLTIFLPHYQGLGKAPILTDLGIGDILPYQVHWEFTRSWVSLLFWLGPIFVLTRPNCFPGGSDGKESAYKAGDLGSIPGLGRSLGGGHGNPLQYSCLENPYGQRSLITVHGVTKNMIEQLSRHTQAKHYKKVDM